MAASEQPAESAGRWPARLHVVTGKGGTGKTSVAAALALGLAAGGRRTLLVEVEGRQGIAQLFGTDPLPYEERHLADAPGGGEVRALAVDAEEALLEYLDMFYKLGAAGRALRKLGAIDFATTIAPGLRDVLLTGKVKEATTRTSGSRRTYDAVVLDAPPTGRIGRFLNVTAETARLAKVGPIKTQSEGVSALLRSPMTAVHVVTLLEEMPVQETLDAVAELTQLGFPVGRVIVNGVRPPVPAGRAVTAAELKRGLAAAGLPTDGPTVAGLVEEARDQQVRRDLEDSLRGDLVDLGLPLVELPLLPEGVDRAGLETLAEALVRAD
ncbi:ArsA-related P-loop ATPase [Micromonospora aurantiaca]|uniref:ArsA-related P-loop ATPase n=1 Tax=Micromonospora TaxID=1873 RepID=UPI0001C46A1E|nr:MULTISPECIES: ArsA-related P-loop ATPase [Micromonospora]ADU08093.1 anion-transporting ATPase [Micromonospora sp. L5]MBC9004771.1 ArsA family ATPase [Micromonospora aurantiaca]RNI00715.1 ATPase [Micromonospora aurantiaca]SCL40299.1 arsenite efflux ATP-binding protein ArsA [Micromonospora aurantiaca]